MSNPENGNGKDNSWSFLNKYGLILIIGILIVSIVFLFTFFLNSNKVNNSAKFKSGENEISFSKIEANAGNISIQSGNIQHAVILVSASGSREENPPAPWVKTGIKVSPKDKVKIEASGSVHTALKKLIIIAQTDMIPDSEQYQTWTGPGGYPKSSINDWDYKRRSLRLLPDQRFGALVAAIWNDKGLKTINTKEPINAQEFEAKEEGELVLAVNDLMLNGSAQNLYAFPVKKENDPYYESKLKYEIEEGDKIEKWSQEKKEKKYKELYNKRLYSWQQIEKKGNWTVWFDDNVGEFFVSITKIQKKA
jgi:hypothetical protein